MWWMLLDSSLPGCRSPYQMIWESGPWKQFLLRDAIALQKQSERPLRARPVVRLMARMARIERIIFGAAFSVRKLMEASKLSDECRAYRVQAHQLPASGKSTPDFMNWHRVEEHFSLELGTPCALLPRELCNLLIHSFQFIICVDDSNRPIGFLASSDRRRKKCLHYVSIQDIIGFLVYVATDDIAESSMARTRSGDIRVLLAKRDQECCPEAYRSHMGWFRSRGESEER